MFKKIILLSLLSVILSASSCSLFQKAQSPPHDTAAETLSKNILDNTRDMYEQMKVSEKNYAAWVPSYNHIMTQFGDLISIDTARLHNTVILKLTNSWRDRFATYQSEHYNYDSLNNGQIQVYQDFLHSLGNKVYLTEKNYK